MPYVVGSVRLFRALLASLCALQFASGTWADEGAASCISGIYVDAVVSAGSTVYVFRHGSGVELSLSVPNEVEAAVELEADMLRLFPDGPAEANEALLGNAFDICFGPNTTVRISAVRK